MLYNDVETLDPFTLCVVIQMKASQKITIIVERQGKSRFEGFLLSFFLFFHSDSLSKSRNLISRPCKTIVSLTAG